MENTESRRCYKCGETKRLNEINFYFSSKRKGTYYKACKDCVSRRGRQSKGAKIHPSVGTDREFSELEMKSWVISHIYQDMSPVGIAMEHGRKLEFVEENLPKVLTNMPFFLNYYKARKVKKDERLRRAMEQKGGTVK